MLDLELSYSTLLPPHSPFLVHPNCKSIFKSLSTSSFSSSSHSSKLPKSDPLMDSFFAIYANHHRSVQWTADIFRSSSYASTSSSLPTPPSSSTSSSPEGLSRKGDGIPADEEGGRRRVPTVRSRCI